jgi:hypothetical protein
MIDPGVLFSTHIYGCFGTQAPALHVSVSAVFFELVVHANNFCRREERRSGITRPCGVEYVINRRHMAALCGISTLSLTLTWFFDGSLLYPAIALCHLRAA